MLEAVEGGHQPGVMLLPSVRAPSSSSMVPCSMESTPARTAALMPAAPSAWAMTFFAGAMGDLDGLGHLRFAQFLHVEVGDGVHHAAGGHQLDPVGAVFDVAAHDVGDVVNSVGDILAAGKLHVGGEGRAVAMASGERDATACGGDARAEDDAALD